MKDMLIFQMRFHIFYIRNRQIKVLLVLVLLLLLSPRFHCISRAIRWHSKNSGLLKYHAFFIHI